MANALYDPGREGFLDGSIDWDTDDIRTMLVLSTYTFSAAHKFITDLGAVDNGRTAALGSKTVTSGIAPAVGTGFNSQAANTLDIFFTQTVATGSMTVHQAIIEQLTP